MTIFQRLRGFLLSTFGVTVSDEPNIVENDIFIDFLHDIAHQEGNSVEAILSSALFDEQAIGSLHDDNLIIYHYLTEDGNWYIMSDTERLSRFDTAALESLETLEQIWAPQNPSWKPNV